ncbi:type III secretion protein [Leclercia adecarboxylata]|nr:type III secretion protein [Leclercia adecarboxylata]KMN64125.1 type III secretion protein [Leclercia sp. LK8]
MRADDSRMMAILYDPASYSHASHIPDVFRGGEIVDATLLNLWLIRQQKLEPLPVDWHSDDDTLSRLLSQWYSLPAIAHLTGGYLLRQDLTRHGALLMSDPRLLAFISLPMIQPTAPPASLQVDTTSCGISFILRQFPDLPAALRQRLLLHFPAGMPQVTRPDKKNLNNINLLRMALTYAHHYY